MNEQAKVMMVPTGSIRVSRTNPRKRFDEKALKELEANIQQVGLFTPLVVRPVLRTEGPAGPPIYELVSGERRFRCVVALKMPEVMCTVRELSDQQALEIQIIENLQRSDLDPIEQAEGFARLMELGEMDAKQLAVKVSKAVSSVYRSLKLLFLPPAAREALLAGRIGKHHAFRIAVLPHKEWREEATRIVLDPACCGSRW